MTPKIPTHWCMCPEDSLPFTVKVSVNLSGRIDFPFVILLHHQSNDIVTMIIIFIGISLEADCGNFP
jgi:hypothetical protein